MAYQKEHISTLDNHLFTVLQKLTPIKGGKDVTASLYSQMRSFQSRESKVSMLFETTWLAHKLNIFLHLRMF